MVAPVSPNRLRELRFLLVSFLGLLVLSPVLAVMLQRAWETEGLTYHVSWALFETLGYDIYGAITLSLGLLLGWGVLLWADHYKRVQAGLLTVSVLLGLAALRLSGRWDRPEDVVANAEFFLLGFLAAFLLGGGARLLLEWDERPHLFPYGASGFAGFVGFVVTVGWFERHFTYRSPVQRPTLRPTAELADVAFLGPPVVAVGNAVAVGLFAWLLWRFVQYEADRRIVVLGPRESGKTATVVALYHGARDARDETTVPYVSPPLADMYYDLAREGFDALEDVPGRELGFTYTRGGLFPVNVTVEAVDYDGSLLGPGLVSALRDDGGPLSRLRRLVGLAPTPPAVVTSATDLAAHLRAADVVLLAVPAVDYLDSRTVSEEHLPPYVDALPSNGNDAGYLETYLEVVDACADETDFLAVATMTDVLVDNYEEDYPSMFADINFDEGETSFRWYVSYVLSDAAPAYGALQPKLTDGEAYPLYYELDPESEEPVLETDEGDAPDRLRVRGAHLLLRRLGR